MKLVVGLGNPGTEYDRSRHNAGFLVADELLRRTYASPSTKFKGQMARVELAGQSVVLLKPMTFMNLSGESVGACGRYFGIEPADMLVIHDELDLPFGELRIKRSGGHAGHNGLRSIFKHFAPSGDFPRLRFGIGRPQFGSPREWVLAPFSADDRIDLDDHVCRGADAVEVFLRYGVSEAMNQFNRKTRPPGEVAEQ